MGMNAMDKMKINLAFYQFQVQSTSSYNPTPLFTQTVSLGLTLLLIIKLIQFNGHPSPKRKFS